LDTVDVRIRRYWPKITVVIGMINISGKQLVVMSVSEKKGVRGGGVNDVGSE
jgi:hypothetical protein